MMRKLAVAALCFTLGGLSGGQDHTSRDGTMWNALQPREKAFYAVGFMDGSENQGNEDGFAVFFFSLELEGSKNLTPEQESSLRRLLDGVGPIDLPDSVTAGQIENAVTTFYGDYRNAPVCWGDATEAATLSLAGKAPTEKKLEGWRTQDAKIGCGSSSPPSTKKESPETAGRRLRVFLEVWDTGGITRPELETGPLEPETQLLVRTCPQVVVTVEPRNSDFTLRLTHHIPGVRLFSEDNAPPDHYRDYYQWSLIDKKGEIIRSGSDDSLPGVITQACGALMKN